MSFVGYASEAYARSLAFAGEPLHLPACGGWVLRRAIPGTPYFDAMGPYPLFACRDWSRLGEDLAALKRSGLVSLTLVADPFAPLTAAGVTGCFDLARPFKRHFVARLGGDVEQIATPHHLRNARRGLRRVQVNVVEDPSSHLDGWVGLYGELVARKGVADLRRFNRESFRQLLAMDDLVMLRASREEHSLGYRLFIQQGDTAYCHLSAYSRDGYRDGVSYALSRSAIDHFARTLTRIDWGGGVGAPGAANDGLAAFKAGWSNDSADSWLLGAILDAGRYAQLSRAVPATQYFPAYRHGEFGQGAR